MLVQPTWLRHIEPKGQIKFREMEEAFFTETTKEFTYSESVVGLKNDIAKKLELDKCLAIQVVLIPR